MMVKSEQYPEGEIHQTIPERYLWRGPDGNWWLYYANKIFNVHVIDLDRYGINYKLQPGDRKLYPEIYRHFEKVLAGDFFRGHPKRKVG